jgi:non-heme chloroperoxidase
VLGIVAALALTASPFPPLPEPRDLFDFSSLRKAPADVDVPSLRRYTARDGEQLAYRYYDSAA